MLKSDRIRWGELAIYGEFCVSDKSCMLAGLHLVCRHHFNVPLNQLAKLQFFDLRIFFELSSQESIQSRERVGGDSD